MFETFSVRQKRLAATGEPEVYRYDELTLTVRNQILHLWDSAIGTYHIPHPFSGGTIPASNEAWEVLEEKAAREFGLEQLGEDPFSNPKQRCTAHLAVCSVEQALDLIELSFGLIDKVIRNLDGHQREGSGITQSADSAIVELNHRFRQNAIGYRFENGSLLRIDSEILHAEVVKPALRLLAETGFAGANDEYRRAHEHHLNGRHEEALADCLKAFESVMKVVCDRRGWKYSFSATAKDLIKVVFEGGLLPDYLTSEFNALRSLLESGVPTVRNKVASHGRGSEVRTVPDYLAAYALHLTAANVLLLTAANKRSP